MTKLIKKNASILLTILLFSGLASCSQSSTTPEHSHTWDDGKIIQESTCSKEGVKTYYCSGCSETKSETIPATGKHNFSTKWASNNYRHWHECSSCDVVTDVEVHDYDTSIICKCGKSVYTTCSPGDFILNNGTVLRSTETLTNEQKNNIAAIVIRVATDKKSLLVIGINTSDKTIWCNHSAGGYDKRMPRMECSVFTKCSMTGTSTLNSFKSYCEDYETNPNLYPAWNYCLNYGVNNKLTGNMADGWVLPSFQELRQLYVNKTILKNSFKKIGIEDFFDKRYWSSCQDYDEVAKDCTLIRTYYPETDSEYTASKSIETYIYACAVKEIK